jgi:hypothetical protein
LNPQGAALILAQLSSEEEIRKSIIFWGFLHDYI